MKITGIKTIVLLVILIGTLGILSVDLDLSNSAYAEEKFSEGPFFYSAGLRTRSEVTSWFGNDSLDKDYMFHSYKAQLGLGASADQYRLFIQEQFNGMFELPFEATGVGATYRAVNENNSNPQGERLRQAFALVRDQEKMNYGLQIGRFLYSNAEEKLSENSKIKWLQQKRLAQRLIGPFDYSFGRSFDGFRADVSGLTGFLARPTEGGFLLDGDSALSDVSIGALTYSANWESFSSQLFTYSYSDDRSVLKPDNRPLADREADFDKIDIISYGANTAFYSANEEIGYDAVLMALGQAGDWGDQDQKSYAFVAETGLHFLTPSYKPIIRLGLSKGSGDSNPNDDDHETFFQMLPTARAYALTPFYNMENNEDIYLEFQATPLNDLAIRTQYHLLHLAEADDFLYSGAGAGESKDRFGFNTLSLGGDSSVGSLFDIEISYALSKSLALTLYYGHLFGGDGISSAFPEGKDSLDYGFLELNYKL